MKVQEFKRGVLPASKQKLSEGDLELFRKMDLCRLLPYLRENSFLWSHKPFFENMAPETLEELVEMLFNTQERQSRNKRQQIFHILAMVKQNTAFIECIADNQNVDKSKIFKFLTLSPIPDDALYVCGDILTNYARDIPTKLLKIIKNQSVLTLLTNKLHLEPIHKIIFTMIFCLGHKPSLNEKQVIQSLLDKMLKLLQNCRSNNLEVMANPEDKIDYSESMANMINEIVKNVKGIYLGNIQLLLQTMDNSEFIERIYDILEEPVQSECSQYLVLILANVIRLHHQLLDLRKNKENSEKQTQYPKVTQYSHLQVKRILSRFPEFLNLLIKFQEQTKKIKCSTGQNIRPIGFLRYEVLQLIKAIFQLEFTDMEKSTYIEQLNILPFLKGCLIDNKWNNITQSLMNQVFKKYLKVCYESFKKENLATNIAEGFLGFLIENYRNKNIIYLTTMRFSRYGDRHSIYTMSKDLVQHINKRKQLQELNAKFPHWEDFMQEDLKEYQKKQNACSNFNEKQIVPDLNIRQTATPLLDPIETIEEILDELEDQKRWSTSPKSKKKPRRRKQSLAKMEVVQQIDSLRHLELDSSEDEE